MPGQSISVVIPAYNEEQALPALINETIAVLDTFDAEIVVVDDGSIDETWSAIQLYATGDQKVTVRGVCFHSNRGKSTALAAGFDAAKGDIVITMDADGQNDPSDIPRMLEELDAGADCVWGNRQKRQDGLDKRIPSWIQTKLAVLTGPNIHDFGCGLAAYWSYVVEDLELYGDRHRYIPSDVHRLGYEIKEIDVNHRPRNGGASKFGKERLLRGFVDLWFWVIRSRWDDRPMHFLGGIGVISIIAGGLIGLFSVVQKFAFGVELAPRIGRLVLVALLIIFGAQLFVFGVLAEVLTGIDHRGRVRYRVAETAGLRCDVLPGDAMGAVRESENGPAGDQPRHQIVDAD